MEPNLDDPWSRKLATASWSPSCVSKVLGGLESPIAWNFIRIYRQQNLAASASSASLCFHAKLPAELAFVPYLWDPLGLKSRSWDPDLIAKVQVSSTREIAIPAEAPGEARRNLCNRSWGSWLSFGDITVQSKLKHLFLPSAQIHPIV